MIKNFTIYGERCSGTNFLEAIITGNSYFHSGHKPAFDVPITWDFGHKHFFGFNDQDIVNYGSETLFIGIVRHPYDWMNSLFANKHHLPQINYSPENFLFGEWYSIDHDRFSDTFLKEYLEDRNYKSKNRYKNIFELRRNKCAYLYNHMPQLAENYLLIRYEELKENPNEIVESISSRFGLKIINRDFIDAKITIKKNILEDYEDKITKNIDWKIENLIGYNYPPRDIIEFYQQNTIHHLFDDKFYALISPEAKDFYQPFCTENNISDRSRLFYHYKTHGIYQEKPINSSHLKEITNINLQNIGRHSNINDIISVDKMFIDSYKKNTDEGKNIALKSKISVVALARNCESQIENSINSIYKIKSSDLDFFIYENDSTDTTKDIIINYTKKSNLTLYTKDLNRKDLRDRSVVRTTWLAEYRNFCQEWVRKNYYDYNYTIVLDLDADLGFSIDGIYNSIYWLSRIKNAGGMGSYSLTFNDGSLYHYDSFAVRLNDWHESNEQDYTNQWFRHWHPLIGSNPVPFYSCFGGLSVYKTEAFLSGAYSGELGSEHIHLHKSMKEKGWSMYLNPSSVFFSNCDTSQTQN